MLVIGSGPAGKAAVVQATKLDKRVPIVDERLVPGGGCVHTGTLPSKSLRQAVLSVSDPLKRERMQVRISGLLRLKFTIISLGLSY